MREPEWQGQGEKEEPESCWQCCNEEQEGWGLNKSKEDLQQTDSKGWKKEMHHE
jgi:hypothetical protein